MIISRAEWGARSPRSRITTTWSKRTEFVVHYSEGPTTQTPRQIQDFHLDVRGWSDIAYNFLVDTHGRTYEGRGWLTIGAHATGHNTSGIGVCFIGRNGDATPAAKAAIRALYDQACARAGRTLAKRGHRDVGSTDCPGDQLAAWVHQGMPGGNQPAPAPPELTDVEDIMAKLPILRRGATGEDVQSVQHLLLARSRSLPNYGPDGDFGAETLAALKDFQADAGLGQSGVCDQKTWAALLRVR